MDGQGQAFIAAGLPVVAAIFIVVGIVHPDVTWCGAFALAMAVPFWYSGMLLRGTSGFLPPGPGRLSAVQWFERIVVLTIAVLTIAFLAIACVFFAVLGIWVVWSTAASYS